MVSRRLLVPTKATVADLHHILQIAMGWEDCHLHKFDIHGKEYGISRAGSIGFADNPSQVRVSDFSFNTGDRFFYEYDFGDSASISACDGNQGRRMTADSRQDATCRNQSATHRGNTNPIRCRLRDGREAVHRPEHCLRLRPGW